MRGYRLMGRKTRRRTKRNDLTTLVLKLMFLPVTLPITILFNACLPKNTTRRNNAIVWKRDFDEMNGTEFEQFCMQLLKKNGFWQVRQTPGSGDRGIDILASKAGQHYAIQCKRYSGSVGNSAIQQAYSGKAIYNADIAVVMTNNYFTKQAIEDARKLGVQLWNRDTIKSLI